jgi:biopolymer transport protein ExbD
MSTSSNHAPGAYRARCVERRKSERKKRSKPEEKPDMTPMIDVTFLLLIFFLCLEFKTLEGKLGMKLPKDLGATSQPSAPVDHVDLEIAVASPGERRLDRQARRYVLEGHVARYRVGASWVHGLPRLQRLLRREAQLRVPDENGVPARRPLRIKSQKGVVYGDVTQAVDVAKEAGFEQIHFAAAR